jgi:membrane-associated phospholipid phosphatase
MGQGTKKFILFALLVAYFIVGYLGINSINMHRAYYFSVSLPFEASIPFIPFFITGYTSVYLAIIFLYFVLRDFDIFKKGMLFFFLLSTVHFVLFILIPVKMNRPDMSGATSVMGMLTHYYYMIDNPVNCFPSLHVAYPLGGTILLWNYRRNWAYLLAFLTLFIAVSVLLVKQHYFLDVVFAFATTFACWWITNLITTPKHQ